ncbi:MAG: phenylalanyl-tRNA synthetase alpha chain, partial [Flavobacteriales bacterium]
MIEQVESLLKEVENLSANTPQEAEDIRIKYLGKKGLITNLFNDFKHVPNEEKKQFGQLLNQLKTKAQETIGQLKEATANADTSSAKEAIDYSLPVNDLQGARHPLSIVRNEIIEIFKRIGFVVSEGPEIEDDWHNFSALNFPEEHPARDM